jgi:hypothetical protein
MVEEILSITSDERRRWTKDGRLPSSGTTSFKRGKNRVSLPLYSPEAIAALAQGQNLLQSWRAAGNSQATAAKLIFKNSGHCFHPTIDRRSRLTPHIGVTVPLPRKG